METHKAFAWAFGGALAVVVAVMVLLTNGCGGTAGTTELFTTAVPVPDAADPQPDAAEPEAAVDAAAPDAAAEPQPDAAPPVDAVAELADEPAEPACTPNDCKWGVCGWPDHPTECACIEWNTPGLPDCPGNAPVRVVCRVWSPTSPWCAQTGTLGDMKVYCCADK